MKASFSQWFTRVALIGLVAAAFALPSASTLASGPIVVDDDKVECPNAQFSGPDALQQAFDSSLDDMQIQLCFGSYTGVVMIPDPTYVQRTIEIIGVPKNGVLPVINPWKPGDYWAVKFDELKRLTLKNVHLIGPSIGSAETLRVISAELYLSDSIVEGGYYGMRLLGSKGGEVKNTTIFNARQRRGRLLRHAAPWQ